MRLSLSLRGWSSDSRPDPRKQERDQWRGDVFLPPSPLLLTGGQLYKECCFLSLCFISSSSAQGWSQRAAVHLRIKASISLSPETVYNPNVSTKPGGGSGSVRRHGFPSARDFWVTLGQHPPGLSCHSSQWGSQALSPRPHGAGVKMPGDGTKRCTP